MGEGEVEAAACTVSAYLSRRGMTYARSVQAMGEGAIEGAAEEYEIDATNPFSTEFKYSRFHAAHASPRNVSALTGVRRAFKAGEAAGNRVEGASMQGDDVVADVAVSGAATK